MVKTDKITDNCNMRKIAVISFFLTGIFIICPQTQGQNISGPVILAMTETGAYSIIERSNWRRYNNGRYIGLVVNEVRANILPRQIEEKRGSSRGGLLYQGNFFIMQNTRRDMQQVAQAVDKMVPVSFELWENGAIKIENDRGFPRMRDFPVFPNESILPGARWRAPGSHASDPLNTGRPLIIPFIAEYEYRGIEIYRDIQVHRIFAVYASRYQNNSPAENGFSGGNDISSVQGSHRVDILIRVDDGLLVFMQDNLDVTYTLADGSTAKFLGFTLTFGQVIVPMDRAEIIASLEKTLNPEDDHAPGSISPVINVPGFQDSSIDLTPVPEGIRLTIRDIRFVPDSAEFLPEERYRLDLIAEALRQIPDRTFLVEGHTAAVGLPASEMALSIERAKHMVDELVHRGINADRFIYNGWGGTRPIDDNSSADGRSRNRRVEITILE